MTKVLLLGKDGRTDCMAEALANDGAELLVLSDFESPGLTRRAAQFRLDRCDNVPAVVDFARRFRPDLVVVGPEDPLAAGVVDEVQRCLKIPCFGPTQALARLESSKSFTRALLREYDIPGQVEHRVFHDELGLADYARELGEFVVKPDGLTGGKGVRVMGDHFQTPEQGIAYATDLLRSGQGPVLVEEKLEGEEFSLQSVSDGEVVVDLPPVQDHKRAYPGDVGPNTGGMGSYSCETHSLPFLPAGQLAQASAINAATARALVCVTGQPYRGVLYGGFMATATGVRLIEYNARFGDPEALNVIPLLRSGFLDLCLAAATGTLRTLEVRFQPLATVCKYLVPEGYPSDPRRDVPFRFRRPIDVNERLRLYYAAVRQVGEELRLVGSRAVALVGLANSVSEASDLVESAISLVDGPVVHRPDIGTPELLARRVAHMQRLLAIA
ncbi:phosphoribosylamine--glycine ligase [Myxococcota bacterium]